MTTKPEMCPCAWPPTHRISAPPTGSFTCCGQELYVTNLEHPRYRKCGKCGTLWWLRPLDPDTGLSRAERVSPEGRRQLELTTIA